MDHSTFVRIVESKKNQTIICEILNIIEKEKLCIGDAKNILSVTMSLLNLNPVGMTNVKLPNKCWEKKGVRLTLSPVITDTILRGF
jgi:hypothetical protein